MDQQQSSKYGKICKHAPKTYAAFQAFMDEVKLPELKFGKPALNSLSRKLR